MAETLNLRKGIEDTVSSSPGLFLQACHDLVKTAIQPAPVVINESAEIFDDGTPLGLPGVTLLLYIPANPEEARAVLGMIPPEVAPRSQCIAIWAAEPVRTLAHIDDAIPAWLWDRTVQYLDFDHFVARLGEYPSVWSKWFGQGYGFQVLRDEPDRLWQALFRDSSPRSAPSELVNHAAIQQLPIPLTTHVRIEGPLGTGRTTALYQALLPQTDALVIVLDALCSAADLALLQAIIASLDASIPLLFALDDADRAPASLWQALARTRNAKIVYAGTPDLTPPLHQDMRTVRIFPPHRDFGYGLALGMLGAAAFRRGRHIEFYRWRLAAGHCTVREVADALYRFQPQRKEAEEALQAMEDFTNAHSASAMLPLTAESKQTLLTDSVMVAFSAGIAVARGIGESEDAAQRAYDLFDAAKERFHAGEVLFDPAYTAFTEEGRAAWEEIKDRGMELVGDFFGVGDDLTAAFLARWSRPSPAVSGWAESVVLVRVLSALFYLGLSAVPVSAASAFFRHVHRRVTVDPNAFVIALQTLQGTDAVLVAGGYIDLGHPGFAAYAKQVFVSGASSPFVIEVLEATRGGVPKSDPQLRATLLLLIALEFVSTERYEEAVSCLRQRLDDFPGLSQEERALDLGVLVRLRVDHGGFQAYLQDLLALMHAREDVIGILADATLLFQANIVRRRSWNLLESLTEKSGVRISGTLGWLFDPLFDRVPAGVMRTPEAWDQFLELVVGARSIVPADLAVGILRRLGDLGHEQVALRMVPPLRQQHLPVALSAQLTVLEQKFQERVHE